MLHSKCCLCENQLNYENDILLPNGKRICSTCANIICIENNHDPLDNLLFESNYKELRPKEVKEYLDHYIIGQERAKKVISVAVYNHFKRNNLNDSSIKKSNILMIGPTGCGKTHLVKTLAKILDLPLVISPATALTEAGYMGEDVENLVVKLLDVAGGNVNKAERGIIFIDEIDKLAAISTDKTRQVGGVGVQQALLPLLEGTKIKIPLDRSDIKGHGAKIEIDTTNILFICAGAFPEIDTIIKNRISQKRTIGFSSEVNDKCELEEHNLILHVKNEDLREFGLIPEFLGRLPIVVPLEYMTVDILKKILNEPKDSIISQYKKLFSYDSIQLMFEEDALEEIAIKAFDKGTGARSLQSITENLLLDLMFELPSNTNIKEVHITKAFVEGLDMPYLLNCDKMAVN